MMQNIDAPTISTLGELKQAVSKRAFRSYHFRIDGDGRVLIYLHSSEFAGVTAAVSSQLARGAHGRVIFKRATIWARIQMAWWNLRG